MKNEKYFFDRLKILKISGTYPIIVFTHFTHLGLLNVAKMMQIPVMMKYNAIYIMVMILLYLYEI